MSRSALSPPIYWAPTHLKFVCYMIDCLWSRRGTSSVQRDRLVRIWARHIMGRRWLALASCSGLSFSQSKSACDSPVPAMIEIQRHEGLGHHPFQGPPGQLHKASISPKISRREELRVPWQAMSGWGAKSSISDTAVSKLATASLPSARHPHTGAVLYALRSIRPGPRLTQSILS